MRISARAGLSGVAGLVLALPLSLGVGTAATAGSAHPTPMSHADALAALEKAKDLVHVHRSARQQHGRPDPTLALRDLATARPSLTPTERTAADRILARPTDPNDDGLLHYPRSAQLATAATSHFVVHYDKNANDSGYTSAAEVTRTEDVLEHVYTKEVVDLGYRKPLSDAPKTPTMGNPDGLIDVFLGDIGTLGYYGYCASDHPNSTSRLQPAYCVLDNDFAEFQGAPLESLEVTVAHEFFHTVQSAYDYGEDAWLLEGSAVWMEDQVYDSANDYLQFVPNSAIRRPGVPLDYDDGGYSVYGAFLWFTYLSESSGDPTVVRQIWEDAAARSSSDGGLTALAAVRAALSARGMGFVPTFATYAEWNTKPPGSYSERGLWPPPRLWRNVILGNGVTDSAVRGVTVPHLASQTIRFAPTADVPHWRVLRVGFNLPDLGRGATATLQVRRTDGRVTLKPVPLDSHGNATVIAGFDPAKVVSVLVTLTNAGSAEGSFLVRGRLSSLN